MNAQIKQFHVVACWDGDASVWYVAESDVPGLATEASSLDALAAKLQVMIPEMLEANGALSTERAPVPFDLLAKLSGIGNHC